MHTKYANASKYTLSYTHVSSYVVWRVHPLGTIYRYIQIVPMDLPMELKHPKTHDFENMFTATLVRVCGMLGLVRFMWHININGEGSVDMQICCGEYIE